MLLRAAGRGDGDLRPDPAEEASRSRILFRGRCGDDLGGAGGGPAAGLELQVLGGGVPRRFRASELRQILRLAAMVVLSLQRQWRVGDTQLAPRSVGQILSSLTLGYPDLSLSLSLSRGLDLARS